MSSSIFPYKGRDARAAVWHVPPMGTKTNTVVKKTPPKAAAPTKFAAKPKAAGKFPNFLKKLREMRGWTQTEAAREMALSQGGYNKLEYGENQITSTTLAKAAMVFGVPPAVIVDGFKTVPVVGYVGAGAETVLFSEGQIDPEDRVPAPEGSTDKTVAVEIRGESLGALFDQWLVFYDDVRDPPGAAMVHKLCVCWLSDGRVLVKKLARGQHQGLWTLLSNTEAPIYDVALDRAARVRNMAPR